MGNVTKITLVFLVVTILLGTLLLLDGFNIFPLSNIPGLSLVAPTPTPTSSPVSPNILFPLNYDSSGRNIYYHAHKKIKSTLYRYKDNVLYEGVGVYRFSSDTLLTQNRGEIIAEVLENGTEYSVGVFIKNDKPNSVNQNTLLKEVDASKMTQYIVGVFNGWENITQSADKYIILTDPMKVHEENGQLISFPKVRVGFGQKSDGINEFATTLRVEDLSKVIPEFNELERRVPSFLVGKMNSLSDEQLEALIKPGDVVAIKVYLDLKKNADFLDENGTKVASDLLIRRFNPTDSIYKEIGIQLK